MKLRNLEQACYHKLYEKKLNKTVKQAHRQRDGITPTEFITI